MPRRRMSKKHAAFLKENRHRYNDLLQQQSGHCALCPREPNPSRRLDLDHDHARMVIRGLLCHRCNRALPNWITSEWLEDAAKYLRRSYDA